MKLKNSLKIWRRNFKVYTKLYKSSFALNFFEPLIYLLAFGFGLGGYVKDINGLPYIKFVARGIVATSAIFAAIYECTYGTYVRMVFQRTFDGILATPINLEDITLGEILWGATKSIVYGTTIIIVISFAGLVDSIYIIFSIPFIFLSGLVFAEISIIVIMLLPGIDSFNYFYTLIITPSFLFSGLFFPIEGLHKIIKTIAFFNPFYHSVKICRNLSAGNFDGIFYSFLFLLIISILLLPFPFKLKKKKLFP